MDNIKTIKGEQGLFQTDTNFNKIDNNTNDILKIESINPSLFALSKSSESVD